MGNQNSKFNEIYNMKVTEIPKNEGESHIYRNPKNMKYDKDYSNINFQKTVRDFLESQDPNREFLKWRKRDEAGKLTNQIESLKLGEWRQKAEQFGSGLKMLRLVPEKQEFRDYKLKFLGVMSGSSAELMIQDLSCIMFKFTTVGLYATLGREALIYTLNHTGLETICISNEFAALLIEIKKSGKVPNFKNLIFLDEIQEGVRDKAKEASLEVFTMSEIIELGQSGEDVEWEEATPSDVYCFCYTSGTTGVPKAAMMTMGNIGISVRRNPDPLLQFKSDDLHLSYLPMAHVMERTGIYFMILQNAQVAIFGGDYKLLKDDLAFWKPTLFISVPRIYNRFYDAIKSKLDSVKDTSKGKFVNYCINTKLENLEKSGSYTHRLYDTLIFKKMRQVLGGRVRLMLSGSAPIDPKVANFLMVCFCAPFLEGYGQTETVGASLVMNPRDTSLGHVGGIKEFLEFKLVDVPEMGYKNSDIDPETGVNMPRGEFWVRGPSIIPCYYKNEEKSRETFLQDGWMKSGDIVQIRPPNNRIEIIDRKKNIFKLSQGEYIAPEKLENVYKNCSSLVTNVFIHGNSLKNYLLMVVSVEDQNVQALAKELNVCGEIEDPLQIREDKSFERALLGLFKKKAQEAKLNGLEIPKGVVFSDKSFADLGLLTSSFKYKRNDIKNHFLDRLNAKYEKMG